MTAWIPSTDPGSTLTPKDIKRTLTERLSYYEAGEDSWEEVMKALNSLDDGGTYVWIRMGFHNAAAQHFLGEATRSKQITIVIDEY